MRPDCPYQNKPHLHTAFAAQREPNISSQSSGVEKTVFVVDDIINAVHGNEATRLILILQLLPDSTASGLLDAQFVDLTCK